MTVPTPYDYQAVQASGSWAGMSNGVSTDSPLTAGTAAGTADETSSSAGPDENSYRWAAVTQRSPLRIQLDGENVVLPITPESLADNDNLRAGTRVWVQLYGKRVIILGASGGGSDVYVPVGGIIEWPGASVPNSNWVIANGQALSRAAYASLFTVCGTTFGAGDGATTFNVPNYTSRVPAGSGGTYARGATGGAATVSLSAGELPGHTHSFSGSLSGSSISELSTNSASHSHTYSDTTSDDGTHQHGVGNQSTRSDIAGAGGNTAATTSSGQLTGAAGGHHHTFSGASSSDAHSHTISGGSVSGTVSGTSGSTGAGTAHENMPPFLATLFIIRAL